MTKKSSYNMTKNLLFSGVSTFSSGFLFILLIIVGRFLGAENYGVFTTGLALATMFEMFTDIGLREISVRNISVDKNLTEKYIGNLLVWKLCLCAGSYLLLFTVSYILNYDSITRWVIAILGISAFLKSFKHTFRLFFQVHNRFELDALLVFIERLGYLVIGGLVVFLWKNLILFCIVFAAVRLIDFLVALWAIRKYIAPVRFQFNFDFMKKLQIEALPMGMFYLILTVFSYVDTVMLSRMRTDWELEVGLYNAAYRIYDGIAILPTVFYLVILPRLSALFAEDKVRHQRLANDSIKYMYVLALPIVVYGALLSHSLLKLFFGSEFLAATLTMQILFVGLLFQFPNWMLNTTLITIHKQKVILALGLWGFGANIVLNLILIPRYSYVGAAVATVIGELIMCAYAIVYLKVKIMSVRMWSVAVKPVMAALPMLAIFWWLQSHSLILAMILMALVYVGGIILWRIFDRREWEGLLDNLKAMLKGKVTPSMPSPSEGGG